ncbi:Lrp/AsnC family transcriptional regulator, leucine-responsive regulatory protein [Evansella caseinilytica]|uniref:Lrp/AsnC family transcriptional regulator, leucine-responsive regulatory protein n=1 Tax=Evansella caseinilytica TaxID=1503961 RepID=A0A1H3SIC1_9BACI|nr:Lrp/AsnC family transcriptional regulator, leucine-responsive regulatory protein [Evansella caseinilytica]
MKIITLLMGKARMTWAELANEVGLSAPAVADRTHRLEEQGIIKGYGALIDPVRVGCECTAFVAVTLDHPQYRSPFLKKVNGIREIQECHHIAGDYDYLLKVRCRNTKDLDRVLSMELKEMDGISKTRTTIVLDTMKETHQVPLPADNLS